MRERASVSSPGVSESTGGAHMEVSSGPAARVSGADTDTSSAPSKHTPKKIELYRKKEA